MNAICDIKYIKCVLLIQSLILKICTHLWIVYYLLPKYRYDQVEIILNFKCETINWVHRFQYFDFHTNSNRTVITVKTTACKTKLNFEFESFPGGRMLNGCYEGENCKLME